MLRPTERKALAQDSRTLDPEQIDALVREQGEFAFERMFSAMEKVQERLDRACRALENAQIEYAVVGGNAVAA